MMEYAVIQTTNKLKARLGRVNNEGFVNITLLADPDDYNSTIRRDF